MGFIKFTCYVEDEENRAHPLQPIEPFWVRPEDVIAFELAEKNFVGTQTLLYVRDIEEIVEVQEHQDIVRSLLS